MPSLIFPFVVTVPVPAYSNFYLDTILTAKNTYVPIITQCKGNRKSSHKLLKIGS